MGTLLDLKGNKEELDKCKRSPVYFYNNYVRKDTEPVLSEEQYKLRVQEELVKRNTRYNKPESNFILIDDTDAYPSS